MDALKAAYPDLQVEFKHDAGNGYIGFHVTMKQDGVNAEIQLSTPEMFEIKKASDAVYEKWRNRNSKKLTNEELDLLGADNAWSHKLWNDYLEKVGITPDVLSMASSSLMEFSRNTSPAEPLRVQEPSRKNATSNGSSLVATTSPSSLRPKNILDSGIQEPPYGDLRSDMSTAVSQEDSFTALPRSSSESGAASTQAPSLNSRGGKNLRSNMRSPQASTNADLPTQSTPSIPIINKKDGDVNRQYSVREDGADGVDVDLRRGMIKETDEGGQADVYRQERSRRLQWASDIGGRGELDGDRRRDSGSRKVVSEADRRRKEIQIQTGEETQRISFDTVEPAAYSPKQRNMVDMLSGIDATAYVVPNGGTVQVGGETYSINPGGGATVPGTGVIFLDETATAEVAHHEAFHVMQGRMKRQTAVLARVIEHGIDRSSKQIETYAERVRRAYNNDITTSMVYDELAADIYGYYKTHSRAETFQVLRRYFKADKNITYAIDAIKAIDQAYVSFLKENKGKLGTILEKDTGLSRRMYTGMDDARFSLPENGEGTDGSRKYSIKDDPGTIARLTEEDANTTSDLNLLKDEGAEVLTENPERGTRKALDRLAEEYGMIKMGEAPTRKSNLPNRTSENRYLSEYARTLYEANATNENILPALESKITEEDFSHERISNQRILDNLQKTADRNGIDALQRQWDGLVSDTGARIARAEDIAAGQYLYNEYVKAGDYDSAIRMAVGLSAEATRAGQTVQAFRILKKLSPDGQLYAMEQMADKINRELANKLHDKAPTIEIDSALERNLLQAKTKEEIDSAVDAIKQNIADQMPVTWVDKLNAWRYLSMLGNPRTHIRNIVGNAIFVPVRQFKNLIGTGLERAANVDQTQRTKSLLNPKKDRAYIEAGKKSFHDVQDILKGNEKYGTGDFNERRTIFKTKWLEGLRKLNFKALEAEDVIFMRSAYVKSYAQAMKARGLNAETMTAAQERSVSEYAMNEALKATYRDYNALAAALNKFKRSGKVQTLIGEGLFPFTKTPLNVLKRGVEYSPAGVAKGIYEALHDVRNGAKTASEAIDTISAGLSGTGVMTLGAFLAAQGLIVGGNGDDDNEAALDKLTGGQNYAIQIGDKSYTIDWAAPVSMPLFVGVELYNTMQTGNAGASFKNILDSLTKISDPLFNLSMLSSINSAIEAAKYSVGSPLTDIGINIATSYAGQFIPTALGQFARITDDTVRKTYYDKNSGLPKAVDSLLQGALKKIPGASTILQPSVDRWGREIKSGSTAERVLENLISPGYYSERKTTSADEEIDRLYKQIGDSSVIPPLASKYITIDGERINLSAEKYTEYAKTLGQTAYEMVDSIISNKVYAGLTDREKAEAIKGAYDYARETAKAQISEYKPEKWVEELQGSAVNKGLYFSLKAQTSKISNAYDTTTGEKVENTASLAIKDIIDQTTATDGIKKKLYGLLGVNKTVQSGKVTWDGIDRANLSWGDAEIEPTTPGTQSGTGRSTATTIPEAAGYDIPNYKASTLTKISNIGVSPEDYAYIDDRISAKEDKVAYLQELGFDGKQLSGLVESFVMGKTAKDKMRVAEEDMNIDNGTYIDAYIFGYSSVGSKSERNAQIREYVNGLPLSDEQKDALYGWVKVSRGKTADGKQMGGSSGGSGRRRSGGRSGGKSADVSQVIPDSVWNEMRSNVKTPTIRYDNLAWGTLKALLDHGDKIRKETMQQELAAVDATPYMSSAWRAERKREIRKRYERGMMV